MVSGIIYNGRVITADWTKATGSRFISAGEITLIVASDFIRDYPQEVALRFECPVVREVEGSGSFFYRPDPEVA